jgi:predicted transcriptional regulator
MEQFTDLEKQVLRNFLPEQCVFDFGQAPMKVQDIGNNIWENEEVNLSNSTIKGVIGSLVKKGFVSCYAHEENNALIWLGDIFSEKEDLINQIIEECKNFQTPKKTSFLNSINMNNKKSEKIKSLFETYFDGCYGVEPQVIGNPSTYSMGVCKLDYDEKKNELTVHLRRPGLLIGKAGRTINRLKEWLECKVDIIEVKRF